MIEIRIKAKDRLIESKYNIKGYTTLNDIALTLLEIKRIEKRLLEESENYKPIMEITDEGDGR